VKIYFKKVLNPPVAEMLMFCFTLATEQLLPWWSSIDIESGSCVCLYC